jgi:hypothetical protein
MTNSHGYKQDLAAERFGLRVAAHLSQAADDLPHDISERLRVARVQALAHHKSSVLRRLVRVSASSGSSVMTLGDGPIPSWGKLAAFGALMALLFGVFAIDRVQSENRTNELAEIDVAILTDALPPSAYADPGFAQFLKLHANKAP